MKGSQRFSFKLIYYSEIDVLNYHTCINKKKVGISSDPYEHQKAH